MPTVAENLIARSGGRNDVPPGAPPYARGPLANTAITPHPQSVGLKGITDLLKTVRDRSASLFGPPKPISAVPAAPQLPAPNLGAVRTSQLEGGLDALQRRSTLPINPAPPAITPSTTPMGAPTFDYGSFLQQNALRTTEGKK
jgi:hypothetical protein